MWNTFSWRGEPIHDIDAWAAERGEPMVMVRETKKYLSSVTLREHTEVTETRMPRCFAEGLPAFRGVGGESTRIEIL